MIAFDRVLADLDLAGVRLRRAWPRSADHLLLDVEDVGSGDVGQTAGQWFADQAAARSVAADTPGAHARGRVVLQPGGADRRLQALAGLVGLPGSRLVAHRPERRAVVALDGGSRYAKVVPTRKVPALRRSCRRSSGLPIRTPDLSSLEPDAADQCGVVCTEALDGVPLLELLPGDGAGEALTAVGAALARLHRCAPPAGSALHGYADEVAVTRGWEQWARTYGAPTVPAAEAHPQDVPPTELRLIHRDLHDGQLVLRPQADGSFDCEGVGLLDFDLMAAGDPALDLANLVEHLLLRARQGVLDDGEAAVRALLQGYDPDPGCRGRMAAYQDLTRRRLRALYAFRARNLVT